MKELAILVRLALLLLTFSLSAKKVEATPMRSFFKLVYLTIATVTCHNKGMYFGTNIFRFHSSPCTLQHGAMCIHTQHREPVSQELHRSAIMATYFASTLQVSAQSSALGCYEIALITCHAVPPHPSCVVAQVCTLHSPPNFTLILCLTCGDEGRKRKAFIQGGV